MSQHHPSILSNGLVPYPGRFNGQFMTDDVLKEFSHIKQEKFIYIAHNPYMIKSLDTNLVGWTYLLGNANLSNLNFTYGGVTYHGMSTVSDVNLILEMFGVQMPQAWKARPDISNTACLTVLKNVYPGRVGEITDIANIDETTWKAIKDDIATKSKTEMNVQKTYSLLSTIIYTICRTGSPSSNTKANLIQEIKTLKGLDISLDDGTCRALWSLIGKTFTQPLIDSWMKKVMSYFQDKEFIRIKNLIEFAKKRNLTQFFAVKSAFLGCPKFFWEQVFAEAPEDFKGYAAAVKFIGNKDYMGYGPLGVAESKNFRLLGYVGIRLCQKALSQFL